MREGGGEGAVLVLDVVVEAADPGMGRLPR